MRKTETVIVAEATVGQTSLKLTFEPKVQMYRVWFKSPDGKEYAEFGRHRTLYGAYQIFNAHMNAAVRNLTLMEVLPKAA